MEQSEIVLDIWDIFKEHVGEKKREEVLFQYFKTLEEFGIFVEDLPDLRGEDRWIDKALEHYVGESLDGAGEDDGQDDF